MDEKELTKQNETLEVMVVNSVSTQKVFNLVEDIDDCLKEVTSNFFELGKKLYELKENWNQEILNKDYLEFCRSRFNLGKRSVYNFISVYETFKTKDGYLDDKFRSFNFSQLVELLPLNEDKDFASQYKAISTRKVKKLVDSSKKYINKDYKEKIILMAFDLLKEKAAAINLEIIQSGELKFHEEYNSNKAILFFKVLGLPFSFEFNDRFYLAASKYVSDFDFYFGYFSLDKLSTKFDSLLDELNRYKLRLENSSDEQSLKCKEKFVPTGAVKRLGLKKKDIIPYVDNPDNYIKIMDLRIADSFFCEFEIRSLRCCDYIFAIFRKPNESDYLYSTLSDEEKNSFKLSKIIDRNFVPLNKWDKESLMMKE